MLDPSRDLAFDAFVKLYEQPLVKLAFGYTKDWATAEDVVAETFLALYFDGRFAPHEFSAGEAFAYAKRAVVWRVADFRRARRRRRERSAQSAPEPTGDDPPGRRLELLERAERLWAAIERLTPRQREAVIEYDVRQAGTYARVAAKLGITVRVLTGRLKRARAKLRDLLDP